MTSTVMIAATGSGKGKTTFVTGLLHAIKSKYDNVQSVHAFKCGPDYIDPMFHREVIDVPSTNLDLFFCGDKLLKEVFVDNAGDINIIEAAMGLYDGIGTTARASAMETASALSCKIILLVDGSGIGYSIVPLIKGFLLQDSEKHIAGIVINRISERYYKKIAPVIESETGVKVLGFIPKIKGAELSSRHLGLMFPKESGFSDKISLIAEQISESVDIEAILKIGEESQVNCYVSRELNRSENSNNKSEVCKADNKTGNTDDGVVRNALLNKKIYVARDEAFSFCYEENIKFLINQGASIEYFSPIRDRMVGTDADAIILYGGYPELHAKELSENKTMIESIKSANERGVKIIAECGGFMYLLDYIETDGKKYEMSGVIKGHSYKGKGLIRFGYVNVYDEAVKYNVNEITTESIIDGAIKSTIESTIDGSLQSTIDSEIDGAKEGTENNKCVMKAHEFHHYEAVDVDYSDQYIIENASTSEKYKGIVRTDNVFAGFPHLYYLSQPEFIIKLIK